MQRDKLDKRIRRALRNAFHESATLIRSLFIAAKDAPAIADAVAEVHAVSKISAASALGTLSACPIPFISLGSSDPSGEGSHLVIYLHLKDPEGHAEFLRTFGENLDPQILFPSLLVRTNEIVEVEVGKC